MKKYEITVEQIKQLAKGNAKVKEWFPEVFENKLEVGKWYRHPMQGWGDLLFCFQGVYANDNTSKAFGFTRNGKWHENLGVNEYDIKNYIQATDSEVLEALTNEAIKRGLTEKKYILSAKSGGIFKSFERNYYINEEGCFILDGIVIMKDGKWATIIPTYTKEEAEKLLNAKII